MHPNPLSDRPNISLNWGNLSNLMRLKADLSMWGADLDLQLQPKQAKNTWSIKKVTISQRSSNISNLKDPQMEECFIMSRTLVLSPAMRHVSGAANLPDLKGSQHRSYKLCTNFANMLCGILHDLTVLIVHPPYILCTFFSRWVQNNGVEQFSRLQALDTSPSCTKQVSPGDQ